MDPMNRTSTLIVSVILALCVLGTTTVITTYQPDDNDTNPSPASDMLYVALGDSITYGADRGHRMPFPYPTLVSDKLGFGECLNLAVGGATASTFNRYNHTMMQLEQVPEDADLISVMIGVNDFHCNVPLGSFGNDTQETLYGALDMLAEGLRSKCPDAYIFFITPVDYIAHPEYNSRGYNMDDVSDAIKRVCSQYDISVYDMNTYGEFSWDTDPLCDGIHPTQEYFVRYGAPKIVEFIKEEFGIV